MKISNISAFPIRIQLTEPFHMAEYTVTHMHFVVVKIDTDEGIIGYGEATPAWDVNGETLDSVIGCVNLLKNKRMIGYTLIGETINQLEDIEYLIDKVINPYDSFALIAENSSAKAAIEQALYHIICQLKKTTIEKLYGANICPIPFSTTIGIYDIETTLKHIEASIKKGASTIRLKIGKRNAFNMPGYTRDIQVIHEARKMMKKTRKIRLVADANQAFLDTQTTIEFCRKIKNDLDWLEQPILSNNLLAFREIKNKVETPLMADESATSIKDVRVLLESGGIDFLNIKLMKTGGIRGAVRLIDLAEEYGVKCQIGSMIESMYGILMGCTTYFLRNSMISTDLYAYHRLGEQYTKKLQVKGKYLFLKPETEWIEVNKLKEFML